MPRGQNSVQFMCEWQALQPALPEIASIRASLPASRKSLTSVQARLSGAGPR